MLGMLCGVWLCSVGLCSLYMLCMVWCMPLHTSVSAVLYAVHAVQCVVL